MGTVLQRTAISTNVKERLDFSCAVFDAEGNLIANAPHIPVHLGAMGESVRHVLRSHPRPRPGDAYVTNNPYRGGSHLPDITVVTPVFLDQPLEERSGREAELVVAAAALGERRHLRAGVIAARVGVLPDVAPAEERRQEPVDGADVELRARRQRRDADLAVGAGEGLEEVEGAVHRLHRAARAAGLGGFFHRSELPI